MSVFSSPKRKQRLTRNTDSVVLSVGRRTRAGQAPDMFHLGGPAAGFPSCQECAAVLFTRQQGNIVARLPSATGDVTASIAHPGGSLRNNGTGREGDNLSGYFSGGVGGVTSNFLLVCGDR